MGKIKQELKNGELYYEGQSRVEIWHKVRGTSLLETTCLNLCFHVCIGDVANLKMAALQKQRAAIPSPSLVKEKSWLTFTSGTPWSSHHAVDNRRCWNHRMPYYAVGKKTVQYLHNISQTPNYLNIKDTRFDCVITNQRCILPTSCMAKKLLTCLFYRKQTTTRQGKHW